MYTYILSIKYNNATQYNTTGRANTTGYVVPPSKFQ